MQRRPNPMAAEYGPGNQYMVGPYDPSQGVYMNQHNSPMPPPDRNLMGAGLAGAIAGGIGGGMAGGPPGAMAMGALGVPTMMAWEAFQDYQRRQPKRDSYNNEYPQQVPNHLAPRF
jgi:predicted lipid-binding transport protein (Tim44 family)